MSESKRFQQEIRLRTIFTTLALEKGFWREVVALDFFRFFHHYEVLAVPQVRDLWIDHLKQIDRSESRFSFYLHVPFCAGQCDFCQYFRRKCRGPAELEEYADSLIAEMRAFRDIFQGVRFRRLYLGGGTPSLFSAATLRRIFSGITEGFSIDDSVMRMFECSPASSSAEKLAVLADYGINKLSLGVQSMDPAVLKGMNRAYQSEEMVRRCVTDAQKFSSFETINADLLIGLHNDTPETVLASFVALAQLKVNSISVYPLNPTSEYLRRYFDGDLERYDAQREEKLKAFEVLVIDQAKHFGYDFLPRQDSVLRTGAWKFLLESQNRLGYQSSFFFNCFGVGVGAASKIKNFASYENRGPLHDGVPGRYMPGACYRGRFRYSEQDEKLYFVLENFQIFGRLPRAHYQRVFGSDVLEDFSGPLEILEQLNFVTVEAADVFFHPRHRMKRFIAALFFVEDQDVLAMTRKLASDQTTQISCD